MKKKESNKEDKEITKSKNRSQSDKKICSKVFVAKEIVGISFYITYQY
jgi:hypothetical protein